MTCPSAQLGGHGFRAVSPELGPEPHMVASSLLLLSTRGTGALGCSVGCGRTQVSTRPALGLLRVRCDPQARTSFTPTQLPIPASPRDPCILTPIVVLPAASGGPGAGYRPLPSRRVWVGG